MTPKQFASSCRKDCFDETVRQIPNFIYLSLQEVKVKKGKAVPATGRGGPLGCETSRLPHFLNSRLTDGGEVSLTRRPLFTPRKIPGTHFC
jgi:hypothetical protein